MKRVFRFIFKLLVVLLVLAGIVVVLFETQVAGKYMLDAVGNRFNVDLAAESVEIKLDGTLRLREFSARLLDEHEPFFSAENIEIGTSSARELISTRQFKLCHVRIVSPELTIVRDQQGQLNISKLQMPERADKVPELPEIDILNGRVNYRSPDDTIQLAGIRFNSEQAADKLKFRLNLPGNNRVGGTINLGNLNHDINFLVNDISETGLSAITQQAPIHIRAHYVGTAESREPLQLQGQLDIQHMHYNNLVVRGNADIFADQQAFSAVINQLTVDPSRAVAKLGDTEPVLAQGGVVRYSYDDNELTADLPQLLAFGGQLSVNTVVFPGQWSRTTCDITYRDIELSVLIPSFDQGQSISGHLKVFPASESRPIEPIAFSLGVNFAGEQFDRMQLSEVVINGHAGRTRVVATGDVGIFDGQLSPWISLTRRGEEFFVHSITDFAELELDNIVRTFKDAPQPVPGRLSGTARLRTSGQLDSLSANADISITESDLVHTEIIGTVYNALNLRFGSLEPRGRGTVRIAAYGPTLEVTDFVYFNRGVEVLATGVIENLSLGLASPVRGVATGSLQPLRDTDLPGTGTLDRMIQGLQIGAASAKVEGTVGQTETRLVALPEIQRALRGLLHQGQ